MEGCSADTSVPAQRGPLPPPELEDDKLVVFRVTKSVVIHGSSRCHKGKQRSLYPRPHVGWTPRPLPGSRALCRVQCQCRCSSGERGHPACASRVCAAAPGLSGPGLRELGRGCVRRPALLLPFSAVHTPPVLPWVTHLFLPLPLFPGSYFGLRRGCGGSGKNTAASRSQGASGWPAATLCSVDLTLGLFVGKC